MRAALILLLAGCGGAIVNAPAAPKTCASNDVPSCAGECLDGKASSCTHLGEMTRAGRGIEKDDARAAQLFLRACDGGDARGCVAIANAERSGVGIEKNVHAALEHATRACTAGSADGCSIAVELLEHADSPKAILIRARACELVPPTGCFSSGWAYESGKGVQANRDRAMDLYVRGCNAGEGRSCNNAGTLHFASGPEEDVRASGFFRRSCDAVDTAGCFNWGSAVRDGRGTPRDATAAMEAFARGCKLDSTECCVELGAMHLTSAAPDRDRAHELLWDACNADATNCERAGDVFLGKDPSLATTFYWRGCSAKHETACAKVERTTVSRWGATSKQVAETRLDLACRHDDMKACAAFAKVLEHGSFYRANADLAAKTYEKACAGGIATACSDAKRLKKLR